MEVNKPNVNEGAKEPLGTENKKETMSFDELLKSNKDYQAEFDRRMTKAQTTATENAVNKAVEEAKKQWQLEQDTQKTEAEKLAKMNETQKLQYQLKKEQEEKMSAQNELNEYKMRDTTLKQLNENKVNPTLINFINFKGRTADDIANQTKNVTTMYNNLVEQIKNEIYKEKTPYNPSAQNSITTPEEKEKEELARAMGIKENKKK